MHAGEEALVGFDSFVDTLESTALLVSLIAKFLAFACSLKRTRIKFLRNHRAALEESGIMELPWIWIVLVE